MSIKSGATAVINRAEQIAKEEGRSFSEIAVEKTNKVVRRLYERLGYRRIGDRLISWLADLADDRQVKVVEDCWVLRKFLAHGRRQVSIQARWDSEVVSSRAIGAQSMADGTLGNMGSIMASPTEP